MSLPEDEDYDMDVFVLHQAVFYLRDAPQCIKNDKEVVLEKVRLCGHALQFAGKKLRSDEEVVLAAINKDSFALQYASQELRDDLRVVLAAAKGAVDSFRFASDRVRTMFGWVENTEEFPVLLEEEIISSVIFESEKESKKIKI